MRRNLRFRRYIGARLKNGPKIAVFGCGRNLVCHGIDAESRLCIGAIVTARRCDIRIDFANERSQGEAIASGGHIAARSASGGERNG